MTDHDDAAPPLAGEEHASALSRPYWAALREGRFVLQRCLDCRRAQHYPRALCRWCGGTRLEWAPASTAGTVVAAVLTHRTSREELRGRLPYPVVLVRLDDGPALLATTPPGAGAPAAGSRAVLDLAATRSAGMLVVVSAI